MNTDGDRVQFVIALATALESLEGYSEPSVCRDSDRWLVTLPDDVAVYFSRDRTWIAEEIKQRIHDRLLEDFQVKLNRAMHTLPNHVLVTPRLRGGSWHLAITWSVFSHYVSLPIRETTPHRIAEVITEAMWRGADRLVESRYEGLSGVPGYISALDESRTRLRIRRSTFPSSVAHPA